MFLEKLPKTLSYNDFSFGQKEDLTTRIKNILDEYSGEIDIFKEMIQNADDAGASEIHFICDARKHGMECFQRRVKACSGTISNCVQ